MTNSLTQLLAELPSAQQLEKLPLRAIAAYAIRSAERVRPFLSGTFDDAIIASALSFAKNFASARPQDVTELVATLHVLADLVGVVAQFETRDIRIAAMGIHACASAACWAYSALDSLSTTDEAYKNLRRAAKAAGRSGRAVIVLGEHERSRAIAAALRDYETLVSLFGQHDRLCLGPAIDTSEYGPLGPLWN